MESGNKKAFLVGSLAMMVVLQFTACQQKTDTAGKATTQAADKARVTSKDKDKSKSKVAGASADANPTCEQLPADSQLKAASDEQRFAVLQIRILSQAHQMLNEASKVGLQISDGLTQSIFSEALAQILTVMDENGVRKAQTGNNSCTGAHKQTLFELKSADSSSAKMPTFRLVDEDCQEIRENIFEAKLFTKGQVKLSFRAEKFKNQLGTALDRTEREITCSVSFSSTARITAFSCSHLSMGSIDFENFEYDQTNPGKLLSMTVTKYKAGNQKDENVCGKQIYVPLEGKIQIKEICIQKEEKTPAATLAPVSETPPKDEKATTELTKAPAAE